MDRVHSQQPCMDPVHLQHCLRLPYMDRVHLRQLWMDPVHLQLALPHMDPVHLRQLRSIYSSRNWTLWSVYNSCKWTRSICYPGPNISWQGHLRAHAPNRLYADNSREDARAYRRVPKLTDHATPVSITWSSEEKRMQQFITHNTKTSTI